MKRINVTETFLPPKKEYFDLLSKLWESKWLTNRGEFTLELEKQLKHYLNSQTTPLLVNNGTTALQIAIKSMELSGEIITTPFTYIATSSSIIWENCTPVFVDIDPETFNIDYQLIEDQITTETSAILAVHVFGNPCNIDELSILAKKNDLRLIYDAAHCFGVQYNDTSIFDFGDVSTCSFHATKLFQTGEGGAIFSNNNDLKNKIYSLHNFGHSGQEEFSGLGINGKISELNSAMGIALLPYMNKAISKRRQISKNYNELLDFKKLRKQRITKNTNYNYAYYPVVFKSEETLFDVKKILNNNNIFPRRYFYPSLNTIDYISGKRMKHSEYLSKRVLCLPLYPDLLESDTLLICNLINSTL